MKYLSNRIPSTLYLLTAISLLGCDALTREEAQIAIEEAALSSQAETLVTGSIEISTSFTIGEAVEAAAAEIRDFVTAQLPCAEVTLSGKTVSVEYGVNGVCLYNGQQYEGTHSISVSSAAEGDIQVEHMWEGLTNGIVSVTGDATVTWSDALSSRHVVHELEWTRLSDGRSGVGSGDRFQSSLEDDWANGVVVNGDRSWKGDSGQWDLDINKVEARWNDPVPQDGSFALNTPFNKMATLSFDRIDEDTISVILKSGNQKFDFSVNRLGVINTQDQ